MSRVVVRGAGISGHTAAAFLRKWLGRDGEVLVVSPKPTYNWIPSNIWVGVGVMSTADVVLPPAPIYDRHGIEFKLRVAEQHASDLIVMGVRGRGAVDPAMFGSATQHVIRQARYPVITVSGQVAEGLPDLTDTLEE